MRACGPSSVVTSGVVGLLLSGSLTVLLTLLLLATPAGAQVLPSLPLRYVDTTFVPPSGSTLAVPAGGDFQAALNAAQPGDVITLQAGATYTGSFTLPNKPGAGWITVRSSAPDASLPPLGTRVNPSYAAVLPKLVATSGPALQTAPGAHHFRFIGIEVRPAPGVFIFDLIQLGNAPVSNTATTIPHHLVFDRVYVHGDPSVGGRRGFDLNADYSAVIDSYVSDFKEVGADTQAILVFNAYGPFKFVNNYLEAAGENIMFGGAGTSIDGLTPSDAEIRGNYFFKPAAWRSQSWSIKNLFELKHAQRVLLDGNIFDQNWQSAQAGFAIVLTVRGEGRMTWAPVQDVLFRNNIVRNTAQGVNITGADSSGPSAGGHRMAFIDNLWLINSAQWGGNGELAQIALRPDDITFDHNTIDQDGAIIFADLGASLGFTYTNNLSAHNALGIAGSGTAVGNSSLATYFPGASVVANVLWGGPAANYSNYPGNFFPSSVSLVGFVNRAAGDYHLALTSPYKNAATDGTDIGADLDAITLATAGVVSGVPGAPDTSAPTVSLTAPANGASLAGPVTVAATAVDNVGVVGVQFKLDGANLGALVTTPPYAITWNTATASAGPHTLSAQAFDLAGNSTTSASVSVVVAGDTTAPAVTLTAPAAGASLTGSVTLTATATDNVGVTRLDYLLDGTVVGTFAPAVFTFTWNSTTATNGAHALSARAYDAAGNRTTSAAVSVTVANDTTPPTVSITAPTAASTVAGTVSITATAADNVGVLGVQFKLDGANLGAEVTAAPYTVPWTTSTASNGAHTLTAVARDAAGNRTTSAAITVTVANDTTPPTVSITGPTAGATVAGSVSLTATATDNVRVVGVQFKLDGANLGAEVAAAPYTVPWTTSTASNGAHTLTAVARDAAGNRTTSPAISVTVANDTTPPTVSITAPTAGATVAGSVSLTATATDNVGVLGVQFKLDGANLGAEVTAAPYTVPWTSTITPDGAHTLTAVARDAAGNRTTSAAVSVTVTNRTGTVSLRSGLVAYWTFDEATGATASDASGNGNIGTLVNSPAWVAGRRGSALTFDGITSYVRVPSTGALNSYPLTVAFWMKTASTTGIGGLVNKYADGSLNGYQVYMNAGVLCALYIKDSTSYVDDGSACPLAVSGFNDNAWHQVAFVVDATGGTLYVDGTLRATLGWTGTPGATTTTQELRIGHYPGLPSGGLFAGVVDDVRVWAPALSAADILTLFTGASDTTPPVISAVVVASRSSSGATITWTTSEGSDTQVVYGPTAAYGLTTPLNNALVTAHSQTLRGLAPGVTFHFQVRSSDLAGNVAVSADGTFTTLGSSPAASRKHKKKTDWFKDVGHFLSLGFF